MSNNPSRKMSRANERARQGARTPARPGQSSSGSSRLLLWGGMAAVVIIAVVVGVLVSGDDGGEAGAIEVGFAETIGDGLPPFQGAPDPAVGAPAPTLRAQSARSGDVVDVNMTSGTAKLIGFFAHWCPHCRAELPRIVDVVTATPLPDGVEMLAVSTSVDRGAPNYPPSAWFDSEDWPYEVLVDTESGSAAEGFGLTGFPYWVVVGPDGTVLERASGELGEEQLRALITTAVEAVA